MRDPYYVRNAFGEYLGYLDCRVDARLCGLVRALVNY